MRGVAPDWYKRLMDECPPRTHTVPDWTCRRTLHKYHRYTVIADMMGFIPMPHQRLGWAIMAMPRCGEFVLVIGRQEGKTVLLAPPIVDRLIRQPDHVVVYTAQNQVEADRKVATEFIPMMKRGKLNKDVGFNHSTSQGSVGIQMSNDARLRTMAQHEDALRGETRVGLGIIDEARADKDYRRPRLLTPATTVVEDAQIVVASTAGHAGSIYLKERVDFARKAANDDSSSVTIMEWGIDADEDYDPMDQELWRRVLPALGYTVSYAAIQRAHDSMEPHDFAMEYLGRWLDAVLDEAVPLYEWRAVNVSGLELSGELCLAVDAPPEQDQTVAVAADRHGHVEVVGVRSGHDETTLEWIKSLLYKHPDISTVAMANNNTLRRTGERLAMDGHVIRWYDNKMMHMAASRFWEAIHSVPRQIAIYENAILNEANRGAFRWPLSGGGWVFKRQAAENFASPLIAATLAFDTAKRPVEMEAGIVDDEVDPWESELDEEDEDPWESGLDEEDEWDLLVGG